MAMNYLKMANMIILMAELIPQENGMNTMFQVIQ